jgi:hypothetical protein
MLVEVLKTGLRELIMKIIRNQDLLLFSEFSCKPLRAVNNLGIACLYSIPFLHSIIIKSYKSKMQCQGT